MNEPARASSTSLQEAFERCLHVVTLASLTVAQPLLDLLARHAEFFVAHRFSRFDVGFLIVVLLVLIPLPFLVFELLLTRAHRGAGRVVHGLIVAFFVALLWVLAVNRSGELPARTTLATAAVVGFLIAVVYLKARWLRFFVSVLAVAIVAVPVAFLASPQVRKITSSRKASFHQLPSVTSSAPIVFIIFDEFPTSVLLDEEGEINRHRYPNFAHLASRSAWFPNAFSVAEISEAAIPAILTGSYPKPGHLPTFDDYPRNLFTLFGGYYDVWAREPMTALCPPELSSQHRGSRLGRLRSIVSDLAIVYLHLVVPEPHGARLPPIDVAWRDFAVQTTEPEPKKKSFFAMAVEAIRRDRREEFAALTAAIGRGSQPGLYFLHVLLPHRPWEFAPQDQRYPGGGSIPGLKSGNWLDDEYLAQQAYQRLILQTQFVDAALGRIIGRLEETGLFERSLIVLVGDHGASFRPGDTRRLLSETNAHDIVPVPLLVKSPDQRQARRIENAVSTIDVLPTVLDALRIESPWELEGRSGFDPMPRKLKFETKARGTFEIDPVVRREKYATMRWKLKSFGDGSDPLDLYRLGPDGDLVGRPAGELVDHGRSRWTASVHQLELFEQVSLSDGAPVFVTGSVAGGGENEPCCRLAVALNGTVYGTTRTHVDTGLRRKFTVLLPYQGFREGANRLDLYRLLDPAPLRGDSDSVPLRGSSDGDGGVRKMPLRAVKK